MSQENILSKAEQEKIKAKLQQAQTRLDEMAATARQQKEQAVSDAITALKARRDDIQKKLHESKDASDARASQIKAEIEAKVATFEDELNKLAAKLKSKTTTAR